jgi:GntR family transcriptional regulator, carbon starvation induced regulator
MDDPADLGSSATLWIVVTVRNRSTLGGHVYEQVRAAILSGQLPPGQRLRISDLSAQHDVSLNVVREALNRLTGEQLVQAVPQIGFAVTDLSLEDLADLVQVRVAIESTALRWSIEQGDMTWESQIVAAHYRLANTPVTRPDDNSGLPTYDWIRAHSDFHAVILSGCSSRRMQDVTRSLSDAAELYRRWSLPLAPRDLPAEHAEIMQATLDRDADRAVAALTAHIERTRNTLVENAGVDGQPKSTRAARRAPQRHVPA